MSLHQLANHIQGAGRGQDKMLVHMTPGEVQGLQSLAMAHGGSLTINPQTGLPEAGILSSLLPTILGFALGPAGMGIQIGGLSSAASAGLISGAVGTLATGSLGKGIMAGLGAYGGASLGESLTTAGVQANAANQAQAWRNWSNAQAAAQPSLANLATADNAIKTMNQGVLSSPMLNPSVPTSAVSNVAPIDATAATRAAGRSMGELSNILAEPPRAAGFGSDAQLAFRERNLRPEISFMRPPEPGQAYNLAGTTPVVQPPPRVEEAIRPIVSQGAKEPLSFDTSTPGGRMSMAYEGIKDVVSDKDKLWNFVKDNPMALAGVASSIYSGMQEGPPAPPERAKLKRFRYEYDKQPIGVASSRSAERNYFPNARMVDTGEYYSANGGLMSLAEGGPVESMSRLNAVGANTGYPMADQLSSTYATAAERPISENIIRPQGDANVDPYTGEMKFADGGYTRYTGTRPLDQYKDDYYYVTGSMGGPGYYMYKPQYGPGSGSPSDGVDPSNPFGNLDLSYNPATGGIGGGQAKAAPKLGTEAIEQTRETLEPMYQKYFGRGIDEAGLAAYTARPFSEAELDKIFTGSEEYKPIAAAKAAAAKEASYATPDQAADIYERVMGRTPDLAGLRYYTKTNRMTPEEMEKSLRGSDEYFYNLTKPFVPAIHYGANNIASIEGAPYYDPTQYGFPSSQTNARNEIKGLYQNQLGRIADPRGEQYWADTIGADNQLSRKDIRKFSREAAKEIKERQAGYAAGGGISDLGAYSDGGRLLKGPGDGVSDSIPAVIGERQPARLADGEFVVPARIVSELGNGSTEAGARKLYAMMERIQSARKKSVGKGKVAANTKSEKYLPA